MTHSSHSHSPRWPVLLGVGTAVGFAIIRSMARRGRWQHTGAWALTRAAASGERNFSASATFAINSTADVAYRTWRDFEHVSRFLRHVDSVRVLDDRRSEWTIAGPLAQRFRWVAEIVEDRPGERIAWRSVEGSDVKTHGTIEFRPQPSGRGILVTARIDYAPPAGSAMKHLFRALGRDPEFTVREDLRRFKALVEAGEVPTVVGQSHGPRGFSGKMTRKVLREDRNSAAPQAAERRAQVA